MCSRFIFTCFNLKLYYLNFVRVKVKIYNKKNEIVFIYLAINLYQSSRV